jgi:hypothetical protein
MLERTVKHHIKERLKEISAYQHWPVQRGMGEPCLDCHGCYRGLYFAVEAKRPGKKPTLLQEATISRIRAAGGLVFVVDSPEGARDLVDRLQAHAATAGALHRTTPRAVD